MHSTLVHALDFRLTALICLQPARNVQCKHSSHNSWLHAAYNQPTTVHRECMQAATSLRRERRNAFAQAKEEKPSPPSGGTPAYDDCVLRPTHVSNRKVTKVHDAVH